MLRILAILAGIGFIFAGVSGFIPSLSENGLIYGYFENNFVHNISDIVIGVLGIMAATSAKTTKIYFQIFGIIFALAAIVAFFKQGDLFIMHINVADIIFLAVSALIFLILGFMVPSRRT